MSPFILFFGIFSCFLTFPARLIQFHTSPRKITLAERVDTSKPIKGKKGLFALKAKSLIFFME